MVNRQPTGSAVHTSLFCFCVWDCFKNLEDSRYVLAKWPVVSYSWACSFDQIIAVFEISALLIHCLTIIIMCKTFPKNGASGTGFVHRFYWMQLHDSSPQSWGCAEAPWWFGSILKLKNETHKQSIERISALVCLARTLKGAPKVIFSMTWFIHVSRVYLSTQDTTAEGHRSGPAESFWPICPRHRSKIETPPDIYISSSLKKQW